MTESDATSKTIQWLNKKRLHPGESIDDVLIRMRQRQQKTPTMVAEQLMNQHIDDDGDLFGCTIRKEAIEQIVAAVLLIDRGNL